jgi:hypothetical protein
MGLRRGVGAGVVVGCGGLRNMGRRRSAKGRRRADSVGSHGSSEDMERIYKSITRVAIHR